MKIRNYNLVLSYRGPAYEMRFNIIDVIVICEEM